MLYHYCGYDKFESIIKSKTLWLTQIVKSNDTEEVVRTFDIIWNKIKCEVSDGITDATKAKQMIDILEKQMKTEIWASTEGDEVPYGVCLSVNRDLAQNWNEYGDRSEGIALGFSNDLMVGIPNDMPHPSLRFEGAIGWDKVLYDREHVSKAFIPLIIETINHSQNAMGWINVRTTLKHYSAFIKNPSFQDEREIRIIYYPDKQHKYDGISEVSNIIESPIPHCTLPWIKSSGLCALKEIIIGTNCLKSEDEIRSLLHKYEIYDDITIVRSDYPYRLSNNRNHKKKRYKRQVLCKLYNKLRNKLSNTISKST